MATSHVTPIKSTHRATGGELCSDLKKRADTSEVVLKQILSRKLDESEAKQANSALKTMMNGAIARVNIGKNEALLDKIHTRIAMAERDSATKIKGTITETILAVRQSLREETAAPIRKLVA